MERTGSAVEELARDVGPGVVTGAADDDPSGIATYSQAGARFGYALLWTIPLTYPLLAAVQLVSAHVGRVTGAGLAKNLAAAFPEQWTEFARKVPRLLPRHLPKQAFSSWSLKQWINNREYQAVSATILGLVALQIWQMLENL